MRKPTVTVVIIEDNATRAKLYAHWLDHVAVRVAVTKRQVLDAVDEDLTVAVLDQEFADGSAETVLELIRARTRYCQVLTTTGERGRVVPELDVDNHLTRPIFEDELRDRVERLARQTVYCELLEEFYRTTAKLTAAKKSEEDDEDLTERIGTLEERTAELKPMLHGLRAELDQDDVHAVADLISRDTEVPDEELADQSSKYVPDKCSSCGRKWGVGRGTDPAKGVVRLGSHVWRCTDCGHVQMGRAAGNPWLTHSK